MAIRADTYALSRPVPYLLERAYASASGATGQTIEAPIRQTGDGSLVTVTESGSTVTVTGPQNFDPTQSVTFKMHQWDLEFSYAWGR